jgi:hypothetical protein
MTVGRIPSVEGGIQPTIFDAKADLLTATANDTPARLAVGTNGQVLTADSTAGTGLAWATPSSGAVVQVVAGTSSTQVSSTSATFVDSGLTVTITPTSASNKILLMASSPFEVSRAASSCYAYTAFLRGATVITGSDAITLGSNQGTGSETGVVNQLNMIYLDSPATTSATTYKVQMKTLSSAQVRSQSNNQVGSIIAIEVKP